MFYFALAAIFIRFSVIHEALAVALNLNLYLLYFVIPPTLVGVVATGGIRRTLQARSARLWVAFMVWLCLATVFSAWRGGSATEVLSYAKSEFIMLFIVAGLVVTWEECKLVMYTLALAGATDLAIGRFFMQQDANRVDLAMGGSTIGNANDLAAHLILMMSFLLFFLVAPGQMKILRLACIPALGYGIFLIVGTASRGALLALIVCSLFCFVMGSPTYRIVLIAAVPIAALTMISVLPRATLQRLTTFSSNNLATESDTVKQEAEGSAQQRSELFKKSIEYTVKHPLFGVGPAQFASYEGGESTQIGRRGMWHQTHNVLTEISSECGIPALIFFLGAIISAYRLVLQTYRSARANPAYADIAAVSFCLMLGIVGFMTAALFLNMAYRFYWPALCGYCIVLYNAVQHEMTARQSRMASVFPAALPWTPAQPIPTPASSNKLR